MSLDLDKRQRAMLSEMGIKLWQPASAPSAALAQAAPQAQLEATPRVQMAQAVAEAPAASARSPAASVPLPARAPVASDASAESAWQLGQPQSLYPSPPEADSPLRWLVLAELPAGASEPLEGEAGQLLDNMLRAAGMHRDAGLHFVPVARGRGADPAAESTALESQLATLIELLQPSMVLVMGRLLAQAVLPAPEPFAKRRGEPLSVCACPLLLTYDAAYLLRNLPDKARAWEDLCQARVMAVRAAAL